MTPLLVAVCVETSVTEHHHLTACCLDGVLIRNVNFMLHPMSTLAHENACEHMPFVHMVTKCIQAHAIYTCVPVNACKQHELRKAVRMPRKRSYSSKQARLARQDVGHTRLAPALAHELYLYNCY